MFKKLKEEKVEKKNEERERERKGEREKERKRKYCLKANIIRLKFYLFLSFDPLRRDRDRRLRLPLRERFDLKQFKKQKKKQEEKERMLSSFDFYNRREE